MDGRVCLVTGATNGIGKATAHALAASGATLVIHGRDRKKTEQTLAEIRTASGNDDVHMLLADFASLDEVSVMAREFRQRFDALHVLINNAGVLTDHRQLSRDGFELTFAVNHLAPFLLTLLLLQSLIDGAPARIAVNSSTAMSGGRIPFDDLQLEKHFDGWSAYANTKLANILFSNLLAGKLSGAGVVSNSFCPGLIDTDLLTGNREFGEARIRSLRAGMRPPADGAITAVHLATAPEAGNVSGAFFLKSHGAGKTPVRINWDADVAERLWAVSKECVAPWLEDSREILRQFSI
jgi:NAD(P)-dependent dehydrogenase (short-subunit alcohol dehydrogenase family)